MDYTQYFQTDNRAVNMSATYVHLNDNASESLQYLMRQLHFDHFYGCLPNDWIYKTTLEAFEELENDPLENITIESDIYNTDLAEWLNNPFAEAYCVEAQECEVLRPVGDNAGVFKTIGYGQMMAKERIYHMVNDFLQLGEVIIPGGDE